MTLIAPMVSRVRGSKFRVFPLKPAWLLQRYHCHAHVIEMPYDHCYTYIYIAVMPVIGSVNSFDERVTWVFIHAGEVAMPRSCSRYNSTC